MKATFTRSTINGGMKPIAIIRKATSDSGPVFNAQTYLASGGPGKRVIEYRKSEKAYSQGEPAKNVMYIQKGDVKLSVVNELGKEAVVAILGPGSFFGEGCLAHQLVRRETAAALTPATVLAIPKSEMARVLRAEPAFASHFITFMLERARRIEEDFIDQLFNSSEKRLARTLLRLGQDSRQQERSQRMLAKVTQEMLAEMIGTTRSRVNVFMNKFRKLGFIGYDGGLHTNPSLLNVLIQGERQSLPSEELLEA